MSIDIWPSFKNEIKRGMRGRDPICIDRLFAIRENTRRFPASGRFINTRIGAGGEIDNCFYTRDRDFDILR